MSVYKGITIKQYQPMVQPAITVVPTVAATVVAPPAVVHNVKDDWERWYAEPVPNNRMVLALRCGIQEEISWALDRLLRLCSNEKFFLKTIPGLTDALFEWPEWFVEHGAGAGEHELDALFAQPADVELKRRHALEAVCIFRTATANNDTNVQELSDNPRTRKLILFALHRVRPVTDAATEFLVNILEIFHDIAGTLSLPPPDAHLLANPVPPVLEIVASSSNRSLITASLALLTTLFANPTNVGHLSASSPALAAAIKYLPLFMDKGLVEACLNYLYVHLAHPPMAKAFLVHPHMQSTLKLLVILLLSEQVEETVNVDLCLPPITAHAPQSDTVDFELNKEELDALAAMPEPQRCYEWMKTMFILKADAEVTQVDFWTMYRDIFSPYGETLVATDVIKNINMVYPSAQAMVIPGPTQRFIVKGVSRRKVKTAVERFRCRWHRAQCPNNEAESPGDLYEHILATHLNVGDGECLWSTCAQPPMPPQNLRTHVLTHLPPSQPASRHPSQSDVVTLPSEAYPHPVSDPTKRPLIPSREVLVPFHRPIGEPPSSSLTALLCIRVLFKTSFASADAAPRVDEDHFGFPGIVDEPDDQQQQDAMVEELQDYEKEGEKRGRKAFAVVKSLLEGVRIRDDTLMGWIMEMVSVGMSA